VGALLQGGGPRPKWVILKTAPTTGDRGGSMAYRLAGLRNGKDRHCRSGRNDLHPLTPFGLAECQ
jgi:hypothetical protein